MIKLVLKKMALDKRKEAGHYSGLNENKRSKNFLFNAA
jgi:hypothetical protein